ncbi:MAG: Uma2 family endonuclease [Pseudomonadota bacterium]
MNEVSLPIRQPRICVEDFDEMLMSKPEYEKWELINGRVIKSRVGATWEHKQIVVNVLVALTNHLRQSASPYRAYDETFWVKDKPKQFGAFPDVMVFKSALAPNQLSIDDPTIIVEVLSPGTENHDRLVKRLAYQELDSLQTYILIARDRLLIDVYRRQADGWHGDPPLQSLDAQLSLPEIDFQIAVGDIYRDIQFPAD